MPLPWRGDRAAVRLQPGRAGRGTSRTLAAAAGEVGALTVQAQEDDPRSTLTLYRRSLRIRRDEPDLRNGDFAWIDAGPDVLAFRRGGFLSLTNFGDAPIRLGDEWEVVLASEPLDGREIPRDVTIWARRR